MSMKKNRDVKVPAGKSRTKQEFKKQADINLIMNRIHRTGMVDHLAVGRPIFADVSRVENLHETMNKVKRSEEAFLHLPLHIRARFENKMINLVNFLQDPKNEKEAVELGLLKKPQGSHPREPKAPVGKAKEAEKPALDGDKEKGGNKGDEGTK